MPGARLRRRWPWSVRAKQTKPSAISGYRKRPSTAMAVWNAPPGSRVGKMSQLPSANAMHSPRMAVLSARRRASTTAIAKPIAWANHLAASG